MQRKEFNSLCRADPKKTLDAALYRCTNHYRAAQFFPPGPHVQGMQALPKATSFLRSHQYI